MRSNLHHSLRLLMAVAGIGGSSALWALPEDAKLPIEFGGGGSTSGSLDDGWLTIKGTDKDPARLSQGSLVITGQEVRLFSQKGEIQSGIAIGSPARFEQQPSRDKAVIRGSGKQIKLDRKSRVLSLDADIELNREGTVSKGSHIDYNLDTHLVDGINLHTIIPPKKDTP